MTQRFQLIRINPIGGGEGFYNFSGYLPSFQLIRINPIGGEILGARQSNT